MKRLTLTVATATVLTFVFPQTPPVLAQGHDDGAVGPTLRLDGGPPVGSDNPGQTRARSESTEPSADNKSQKAQTGIEKTTETTIRNRSHAHTALRGHVKHRFVVHRRGHHVFAFHVPRHRFVIHRHGRRFV
jgi:hypothetical protein